MLDHLGQFFNIKFDRDDRLVTVNILTVNSEKVVNRQPGLAVADVETVLNDITQHR